MKLLILAFLSVALLIAAGNQDKTEKDADKLLGRWKLVELELAGEKATLDDPKSFDLRVVIGKDKTYLTYVLESRKNSEECKYKTDNSKEPKWFDLEADGQHALGIYHLEGDRLKICIRGGPKGPRPTEFATKGYDRTESELALAVFEREKK